MADPWRTTTTLTIANGQTSSEVLDFGNTPSLGNVTEKTKFRIIIIAPDTLPEVVNLQVARVAAGPFGILRTNGFSDVTLAAGRADQIGPLLAGAFQLVATSNVAADRVFNVIVDAVDE